ncbi:hypothetical protein BV898_03353 [Hypsibius exemplaris]|uniref:Uncharacterized protein n=1 Tax=Hypsibius exemplaris TaxID=2072580 RepID=A0A1W0X5Q3_HYPEX|nr:hypothetical protein BV898_03353 [Hypsibius exemplaris]
MLGSTNQAIYLCQGMIKGAKRVKRFDSVNYAFCSHGIHPQKKSGQSSALGRRSVLFCWLLVDLTMAANSSWIAISSKVKSSVETPQGSVDASSDGSSSSDISLSDDASYDDGNLYMHVQPEKYAYELVRKCSVNTDERLAMILILLGPEYLQAIVGKFKDAPSCYPAVTEAELARIRSSASKLLDRHAKKWTSAMLINGSEEGKTVRGEEVPPPAWKKGPSKRLKEFYALCSENSFERVALIYLVLGTSYLIEIYYSVGEVGDCQYVEEVFNAAEKVRATAPNTLWDDIKVLRAINAAYTN